MKLIAVLLLDGWNWCSAVDEPPMSFIAAYHHLHQYRCNILFNSVCLFACFSLVTVATDFYLSLEVCFLLIVVILCHLALLLNNAIVGSCSMILDLVSKLF